MTVTSRRRLCGGTLTLLVAMTIGACTKEPLVIDGFPIGEREACEPASHPRCKVIIETALAGLDERDPEHGDVDGAEVYWLDDEGARVTQGGTLNVVVIDMIDGPRRAIGVSCVDVGCFAHMEYEGPEDEGS